MFKCLGKPLIIVIGFFCVTLSMISYSANSAEGDLQKFIANTQAVDGILLDILNAKPNGYSNYIGKLDQMLSGYVDVKKKSGLSGLFLNAEIQNSNAVVSSKKAFATLLNDFIKEGGIINGKNLSSDDALKAKKLLLILKSFSTNLLLEKKIESKISGYFDVGLKKVSVQYQSEYVLDVANESEILKKKQLLIYDSKNHEIAVIDNNYLDGKLVTRPLQVPPQQSIQLQAEEVQNPTSVQEQSGQHPMPAMPNQPLSNPSKVTISIFWEYFSPTIEVKDGYEQMKNELSTLCQFTTFLSSHQIEVKMKWIVPKYFQKSYNMTFKNYEKCWSIDDSDDEKIKNVSAILNIGQEEIKCTKETASKCLNKMNRELEAFSGSLGQ